jgi:hypothetical protein
MVKQPRSPIDFVPLILCLCLGSLLCLVLLPAVSPSVIEFSAPDSAHPHPFSHIEFDPDFFILSIVGVAVMAFVFSKMRIMSLNLRTTTPPPNSPPPKKA